MSRPSDSITVGSSGLRGSRRNGSGTDASAFARDAASRLLRATPNPGRTVGAGKGTGSLA